MSDGNLLSPRNFDPQWQAVQKKVASTRFVMGHSYADLYKVDQHAAGHPAAA